MFGSKIGDAVKVTQNSHVSVGIIRYLGPIEGTGDATYFGIELIVSIRSDIITRRVVSTRSSNLFTSKRHA